MAEHTRCAVVHHNKGGKDTQLIVSFMLMNQKIKTVHESQISVQVESQVHLCGDLIPTETEDSQRDKLKLGAVMKILFV